MIRIFSIVFFIKVVFLMSSPGWAMTVRYALIIGNNEGVDADGKQPFAPLRHAQKEAKNLRNRLVSLSNFDQSNERTKLLLGAKRAQVKEAIRAIAAQKKEDERLLGKVDSLFLFYFTGHGHEGSLLFSDGPMAAKEIGHLFEQVDVDFAVGVFDACYSGSLTAKGIAPTPGLNLFSELPEEVLSAEGRVWYVSSGAQQVSYEDEQLGGVFTHFFSQALEKAPMDGPGITLEQIWNWARQHTVEYTAERNRRQIPEQYVTKLKSSAPVYFSFPIERSAKLVLSKNLEGQFALAYLDGQMTEVFRKNLGATMELAVYPGKARLSKIVEGDLAQTQLEFEAGGSYIISDKLDKTPSTTVGNRARDLSTKGEDLTIKATAIKPGLTWLAGAGYKFEYASEDMLTPRNKVGIQARFDFLGLLIEVAGEYGFDSRKYDAWRYRCDGAGGEIKAGWGWDLGPTRLSVAGAFELMRLWQKYGDGAKRQGWQASPSLQVGLLVPTNKKLTAGLTINAGPTRSPGVGAEAKDFWRFTIGAAVSIFYRVM